MTEKLELSSMIGTRTISGSAATWFRNAVMAWAESSMPSSMLMSMMLAPPSTCSRAMATASSYSPSRISRANFREPATLVRSPTMMKFVSGRITIRSSPLRWVKRSRSGARLGRRPFIRAPRAAMCSGVVPQHPPTRFSQPSRAHSSTDPANSSGPMS